MTVYGRENLYCFYCRDCTNCFGCMGLRNKQYCVFNNQYTKQEYERLVPKLIKQMEGE
ncbi:MAG: hypothetical protein Q8O99_06090 [bacterium]|nr:hypothetical protein [bacterium]